MKGGRSLKVEADRDGGAVLRPHGECGGCARRGGEARDGGEPSSALAVPAGSRADCGPERGERDCRGSVAVRGARRPPPAVPPSAAQRGPEPANGGRSGAAYLGQSPGAGARAGRRRGPVLRRGAWRGGGLGTRWRVCYQLVTFHKRPPLRSCDARVSGSFPTDPGSSLQRFRGWRGRGGRMPAGASATRGGSGGWVAGGAQGRGRAGGEKMISRPPRIEKKPGKDRLPGIDKAGRG